MMNFLTVAWSLELNGGVIGTRTLPILRRRCLEVSLRHFV